MAKSNIRYYNRAFRKATWHWIGSEHGFKSVKEHRTWCRNMAVHYADSELFELVHDDPNVPLDQDVFDEAVSVDMSFWEN